MKKLWIVLECGYEDGNAEVVGTFKDHKEAKEFFKKMMDERDEEDQDWLWYSIKQIVVPF